MKKHLQVLDVGQVVAGNFCGALLGYFGADVIKASTATVLSYHLIFRPLKDTCHMHASPSELRALCLLELACMHAGGAPRKGRCIALPEDDRRHRHIAVVAQLRE